jgi:hypothetical protein
MSGSRKLAAAFLFLIFVSWLFFSCRQQTETEIIAGVLADMAGMIEKKDVAGLIGFLAEDYHDFAERDRQQTAEMLQEYFSHYRGIVVHVLASRIAIEDARNAAVETDVSLSSGAAQAFRKMIRFSGENYRCQCRLRKNSRWLITDAKWEYVAVESLFPESLKLLRELFPNS